MKIANYIRQKRLEKGLSDVEFWKQIGFDGYDLELYDDEIELLSVGELKRVCRALHINPSGILGAVVTDLVDFPLTELLKVRREEKGYTVQELSERCGWAPAVVETLESGGDLNQVSVVALVDIALELNLPFELLFGKLNDIDQRSQNGSSRKRWPDHTQERWPSKKPKAKSDLSEVDPSGDLPEWAPPGT